MRSWLRVAIVAWGLAGGAGCNLVQLRESMNIQRFSRAHIGEQRLALPSGTVRYFDGGSGSPVLLVHGFGFGALENWRAQIPAFARQHRVIAPDLFSFGRSIGASVGTAHAQMEGLRELLDALQVERVDIVATSYGGLLAVLFAMEHPERVARLVLVDAAAIAPTDEEAATISARFGGGGLESVILPPTVDALRDVLAALIHEHHWLPQFVLRQVLGELRRNLPAKQALCRDIESSLPSAASLATILAPTLVVWGRHDPLVLPSMGARIARSIPGARLVVLDRSGHAPMLEEPAAFNQVVLQFLAPGATTSSARLSGLRVFPACASFRPARR